MRCICKRADSLTSSCLRTLQFIRDIPASVALLEAAASLFVALPQELAAPAEPDHLESLSAAAWHLSAALGFLAQDLLEACHTQQQAQQQPQQPEAQQQAQQAQQAQQQQVQQQQPEAQQQAQQAKQAQQQQVQQQQPEQQQQQQLEEEEEEEEQQQQPAEQAQQAEQQAQQAERAGQAQEEQQQPAALALSEGALQLVAAVMKKQHWVLSEMAAALVEPRQPSNLMHHWAQHSQDYSLANWLSSWLRAGQRLIIHLHPTTPGLPLQQGSDATFCAAAAAAEAMLRMQPLFAQLAGAICAAVPVGSETARMAAGLPDEAAGWAACCMLVQRWLAVALLPDSDTVLDCCKDPSAVRAACQLASCAAKHAWWAVQHESKASSPCSSGSAQASSSGDPGCSGSSCAGGNDRSGTAMSELIARAACLSRLWAFRSLASAARIAVVAAVQHPEDERAQG